MYNLKWLPNLVCGVRTETLNQTTRTCITMPRALQADIPLSVLQLATYPENISGKCSSMKWEHDQRLSANFDNWRFGTCWGPTGSHGWANAHVGANLQQDLLKKNANTKCMKSLSIELNMRKVFSIWGIKHKSKKCLMHQWSRFQKAWWPYWSSHRMPQVFPKVDIAKRNASVYVFTSASLLQQCPPI